MDYELVKKRLSIIGAEPMNIDKHGFTRRYKLETISGCVIFELYKNLFNVYINNTDIQIIGYDLTVSGSWPNNYKSNINIHGQNDGKVAIIPVENY